MIDYSPNRLVSTCCMSFLSPSIPISQRSNPYTRPTRRIFVDSATYPRPKMLQDCPIEFKPRIILALAVSGVARGPGTEPSVGFPGLRSPVVHNVLRPTAAYLDLSHLMMCLIPLSKTVIYPMNSSTLIKIDKPAQQCAV